jgi:hypothetical protein
MQQLLASSHGTSHFDRTNRTRRAGEHGARVRYEPKCGSSSSTSLLSLLTTRPGRRHATTPRAGPGCGRPPVHRHLPEAEDCVPACSRAERTPRPGAEERRGAPLHSTTGPPPRQSARLAAVPARFARYSVKLTPARLGRAAPNGPTAAQDDTISRSFGPPRSTTGTARELRRAGRS